MALVFQPSVQHSDAKPIITFRHSNEDHSKTKVITQTNHKEHRPSNEPVNSKLSHVTNVMRGKTCTSESGLVLILITSDWMTKWHE